MKPLLCVAAATLALAAAPAHAADDADAILKKAGCIACHAVDKKMVGPSFKDIAAKNKGNAGAAAALASKVRLGGKGVYGPVPMPPNATDKISDAEIKTVVGWILTQ